MAPLPNVFFQVENHFFQVNLNKNIPQTRRAGKLGARKSPKSFEILMFCFKMATNDQGDELSIMLFSG